MPALQKSASHQRLKAQLKATKNETIQRTNVASNLIHLTYMDSNVKKNK